MPNIIDILARALSLRQETALNSITPNRAGGIMYDTLLVLNQMQLEGGALLISKVYASVSAMEADTTPTSDLTGRALKPGQLVVIVTSDTSSSDMGSEYRYNGPGSWTYVGKVGGLPLDTVPTQSSTKGITSGGVYAALSAMKAEGYKYMGIATPGSGGTAPGTPNQPVFYIAGPGSYPNFGSITVASGYLGFIKYSSGSWTVESVAVGKDYDAQISALDGQITQLEAEVTDLGGYPKSVQDTFTMAETRKYMQWSTGTPGTLNNSFYSAPIPVKAHCKYIFRSRGYNDAFSMISSCDSEGGNIKQEVRSIDSTVRDYEFTPYYDGYIIVSGYTTTDHTLSHIEGEQGIVKDMGENIGLLNAQVLPIVDYENYPSGDFGYVGKDGGYTTNNSYTCVKPVPVKKGDIIDYYCRVENDNIAVIAKTNQAGDTYEPLVLGVDGTARHYTYTCDFDGYVALSGYGNLVNRTYPRELTITHISRIDEKIRDSHKGIVFVGASEKYKTITEGCMAAKNGDVVIVFPGVYDESVNLSCKDCYEAGETLPDGTTATQRTMVENLDHYRSLTIIGTDREKCILTNSTGKYATPALWITDGCVKNMTILGYAGTGLVRQNYAVHIDYYYTTDKSLTFENCYIMTECFACLGCGCKKDLVLTIKDCILENKSTMANTSAVGIHTSAGAPMEARLFNNVMHSTTSERVLLFTHNQASTYGGKLNVMAVGNACKSDVSGTDCVYISDTSDNQDAITMDTRNWNNQASALNS